ncbi:MAG TPA: hypothetical protein PKI60_07950 [Oscillospiraceae bacterium]|nr:hypothetical protein [Oscillospiraceae bacterium]
MKIGQKLLSIFLAISMALSITACGEKKKNSDSSTGDLTTTAASEITAEETTSESTTTSTSEEITKDLEKTVTIAGQEFDIASKELRIMLNDYTYKYDYLDLSSISHFKDLESLEISYSKEVFQPLYIFDYEGLSELKNLKKLTLRSAYFVKSKNDYTYNLEYINNMKSLKIIIFNDMFMDDWSFLNKINNVEEMTVFWSDLSTLDFLNSNTSIKKLTLENTGIKNFDDVNSNLTIKNLDLSENWHLTDITGVNKLKNIDYLYISTNDIDDLEQQVKKIKEDLPYCKLEVDD